jgi:hypothetical protein
MSNNGMREVIFVGKNKRLNDKKAIEQYGLIHKLYNKRGYTFKADVRFKTADNDNISIQNVTISLEGQHYANTPYYNIGINWEDVDHDLSKEQVKVLKSTFSRSASTSYQKMKLDTLTLEIKNDDITIKIEL